jgi:hypothetical protein
MPKLRNYFLIYVVINLGLFLVLYLSAPELLHLPDAVLSDFGADQRTALLFNSMVVVFGVVTFVYSYNLLQARKLSPRNHLVLQILFGLVSLGLLLIGLVPYTLNSAIHWTGALLFFLGVPIINFYEILFVKFSWTRVIVQLIAIFLILLFPTRLAVEIVGIGLGVLIILI